MEKIFGITYPIPKQFVERFFKEGKGVFVKPATVWKELKLGMKFVFYQSQGVLNPIELHASTLVR